MASFQGIDVFCATRPGRGRSRSSGRVRRQGLRPRQCLAAPAATVDKDELCAYSSCCVKEMLGELLEDEEDIVRDIEFDDEDEEVQVVSAEAERHASSAPSEALLCDFDEEVMSLMSDDDLEEDFYDKAATFFVQAALTEADLPAATEARESVEECDLKIQADMEAVVEVEAQELTEDFVFDYVSGLLDAGIESIAPAVQEILPAASAVPESTRPKLMLRSCLASSVTPVPAKGLPMDCLPQGLPMDCLPTSVVCALPPASSESLSLQAQLTKRTVTRSRRRIIGGVVRDPLKATEENFSICRSSSESSLTSKFTVRNSNLTRDHADLGAGSLHIEIQDGRADSRPSRAGSPAWSFRKASAPASAMALDLGFAPSTPSKLADIQTRNNHKSSGLAVRKTSTHMAKSTSLGSLTSSRKSSLLLPSLSGTSRPSSPADGSLEWSVSNSRLSAIPGRIDNIRYAF
mmetsp:Transcript_53594/g.96149  ORF Transcript_53594/g.96149 Transcript_53594/m.96149 type:complete len:462 (+) Transcript_53594:135-1520(+)